MKVTLPNPNHIRALLGKQPGIRFDCSRVLLDTAHPEPHLCVTDGRRLLLFPLELGPGDVRTRVTCPATLLDPLWAMARRTCSAINATLDDDDDTPMDPTEPQTHTLVFNPDASHVLLEDGSTVPCTKPTSGNANPDGKAYPQVTSPKVWPAGPPVASAVVDAKLLAELLQAMGDGYVHVAIHGPMPDGSRAALSLDGVVSSRRTGVRALLMPCMTTDGSTPAYAQPTDAPPPENAGGGA